MREYGPFHRVFTPTQTAADAGKIAESSELWGRQPFGSDTPQVQAWVGPLPTNKIGIEFMTSVAPSPGTPDHEARWRPGSKDVRLEPEGGEMFAKIVIRLTRNTFMD